MTYSSPWSQTGLIPTTHKQQRDLQNCIDNWKRLAPRPPPQLYPFKGDYVHRKRKQSSKQSQVVTENDGIRRLDKERNIHSISLNLCSREKPEWIPFQNDLAIHQYEPVERRKLTQNRMKSLDFIRKSAGRREILLQLEHQLDMELAHEEMAYMTNSIIPHKQVFDSKFDRNNSLIDEIQNLKHFWKEMVQGDDLTQTTSSEKFSEKDTNGTTSDEYDRVAEQLFSFRRSDDGNCEGCVTLQCTESIVNHEFSSDTQYPQLERLILTNPSEIEPKKSFHSMNQNTSHSLIEAHAMNNIHHSDSTSSQILESNEDFENIASAAEEEEHAYRRLASALADGILATIKIDVRDRGNRT